jgi:cation diffusion facilitator CzcD-associated flavoprotein CzcO
MFKPADVNVDARSLKLAPRCTSPVAENDQLPRVCIIGAGGSGLALAKTLYHASVPFDCYEKSDRVGGLWVFKNKNGLSPAYRSLHANTSRNRTSYSDFHFPADWPAFPHHSQISEYLEAYVEWFGFRHKIQFEREVRQARQRPDGAWDVTLDGGETRRYDALCVASGQFWSPTWPDPRPPGRFSGAEFHAKDYVDPSEPIDMRGKKALVVGFGNSALDIASELGRKENCDMVYLSTRRGRWVIPKQFGSRVWDSAYPHPAYNPGEGAPPNLRAVVRNFLPRQVREWVRLRRLEAALGLPHQYGLPQPEESFFDCYPVISSEFYQRVAAGDVAVKPDIAGYDGRTVRFVDGTAVEVDAIIHCTGYKRDFPFFEGMDGPKGNASLWMQIVDPDRPNLFFIGFINPGCGVMPMAEQQAIFVREILLGRLAPPTQEAMRQELGAVSKSMKEGGKIPRWYARDIDCSAYIAALRRVARERSLPGRASAKNGVAISRVLAGFVAKLGA